MKPPKPEYHVALAEWIRKGNTLMYFGDGSDPFHAVREWWNTSPKTYATPAEHLFETLGLQKNIESGRYAVEKGRFFHEKVNPADFAMNKEGDEKLVALVQGVFANLSGSREEWREQNYLHMVRGPHHIIAVLDESISNKPYAISGNFVDVLDPRLAVKTTAEFKPGQRGLLYNIDFAKRSGEKARVLVSASRIRDERISGRSITFTSRGPSATTAATRILLPEEPRGVEFNKPLGKPILKEWDRSSRTLLLVYENVPVGVEITVGW
jgi:hypothetical protein